jgi:hypothetical protein
VSGFIHRQMMWKILQWVGKKSDVHWFELLSLTVCRYSEKKIRRIAQYLISNLGFELLTSRMQPDVPQCAVIHQSAKLYRSKLRMLFAMCYSCTGLLSFSSNVRCIELIQAYPFFDLLYGSELQLLAPMQHQLRLRNTVPCSQKLYWFKE